MTPEVFAPGILSNGLSNGMIYFVADGTEVYFSSGIEKPYYIGFLFYSHMKDGRWVEPEEFPLRRSIFHRPVLNSEGTKLVLISSRAEETRAGIPGACPRARSVSPLSPARERGHVAYFVITTRLTFDRFPALNLMK